MFFCPISEKLKPNQRVFKHRFKNTERNQAAGGRRLFLWLPVKNEAHKRAVAQLHWRSCGCLKVFLVFWRSEGKQRRSAAASSTQSHRFGSDVETQTSAKLHTKQRGEFQQRLTEAGSDRRETPREAKMRSLTGGETFFTRNEMQPHRFLRILFKAPDVCWMTGPGYHLNYFLIWCQFPYQFQCDTSFLIPGVFKPFCYHCYYCSKKTFIFQFCCWFKSGFAPNWVLICSYILGTNVYYTCILLYFIQLNAVEPRIGLLWHDANFYSNVNNKTLRACECLESGPHL